jgi:hypothetical protein
VVAICCLLHLDHLRFLKFDLPSLEQYHAWEHALRSGACPTVSSISIHDTSSFPSSELKSCCEQRPICFETPPFRRHCRVLRETPYFFSTARREGFEKLLSYSRASAILVSNGESIALRLSLLSRVEVTIVRVRESEIMGR